MVNSSSPAVQIALLLGWWRADPIAGHANVYCAIREAVHIVHPAGVT